MATESVIRKREDDAFAGTGLEVLLRAHGAASVVVCGVQSEMCIAATARAAMQRDLVVVLPRDAHGTFPIPADTDGGVAVPAVEVARVAEWSLGDALFVIRSSAEVAFNKDRVLGERSASGRCGRWSYAGDGRPRCVDREHPARDWPACTKLVR